MRFNDDIICSTHPDHAELNDFAPGSCSTAVDVVTGDVFLKSTFNEVE